MWISSLNLFLE